MHIMGDIILIWIENKHIGLEILELEAIEDWTIQQRMIVEGFALPAPPMHTSNAKGEDYFS
jgi:hypothetical protein